jgi:hypothetical protein
VDESRDLVVVTPITGDAVPVDWANAKEADFAVTDLSKEAPSGATFAELPGAAQKTKSYTDWTKSFTAWLTREQSLELLRSDSIGLISKPGEREADFRVRLQHAAREDRDAQVEKLRQKYAPKAAQLQERLRRADQDIQKQQEQASESKVNTAISFGTTVIGALFGRKAFSAGTIGRAGTAARGVGRSMKESQDVSRAQETRGAIEAQLQEVETSLQSEIAGIDAAHDPLKEPLGTLALKPKRTGVQVRLVALAWVAE